MQLVLATSNNHKAEEFRRMFESAGIANITVLLPHEVLNDVPEIEETGSTLEENAYIKARALFQLTGLPCIADDTGLEVSVLDGKPGVHSARYAGENASYSDNRKQVKDDLLLVGVDTCAAQFRTVLCYCDALRAIFAEGICEGEILSEERGLDGFGYDPIFVPFGYSTTFAEMTIEEKNTISHRAIAFQAMIHRLLEYEIILENK